MRKKMLLLALSLAALAGSLSSSRAVAGGTHACPRCTTYADGSRCCVSCVCDVNNNVLGCTNHFCPPAD